MNTIHIDVSTGSCVASCGHCKHGRTTPSGITMFSPEIIETYLLVEAYAHRYDKRLRLSYADALNTITETPPFKRFHTLSLGFTDFDDLFAKQEATVDRIEELVQDNPFFDTVGLDIHASYENLVARKNCALEALETQIKFLKKFPGRTIMVGVNDNTSPANWETVQLHITELSLLYLRLAQSVAGSDVELSDLSVLRRGIYIDFQAEIRFSLGTFILGGRYVDVSYRPEILREREAFPNYDSPPSLAVFPWGVHVDHSTVNINESHLRFSHSDFRNLLAQAESTGADLKRTCLEAASARRKNRVQIPIHTTT